MRTVPAEVRPRETLGQSRRMRSPHRLAPAQVVSVDRRLNVAPTIVAVIDGRRATTLVGETLRELGMLVLVFAPLDSLFQRGGPPWTFVIRLIVLGLILVVLGIMIEAWRTTV